MEKLYKQSGSTSAVIVSFFVFVFAISSQAFGSFDAAFFETPAFSTKWETEAKPHFAKVDTAYLPVKGKIKIAYRAFPLENSQDSILVLPGYSESTEKYAELIYDMNRAGFSVYILDHRGMGRSSREVTNRQIVHIDQFNTYMEDAEKFFDQVVKKGKESRHYLYSHSTGGLIAAKLIAKRPREFRAAVFSAPLFELNTGEYSHAAARRYAGWLDFFGYGKDYAPGYSDFDPANADFQKQTSTSDEARFLAYMDTLKTNKELVMGGPSTRWVKEVLDHTTTPAIKKLAKGNKIPSLLFQAGKDTYVKPGNQEVYCKQAQFCSLVVVPESRHDFCRESDAIRSAHLVRSLEFFQKN